MNQFDELHKKLYNKYITEPVLKGQTPNHEAFNQAWGWAWDKMNAAGVDATKQLEQAGWL